MVTSFRPKSYFIKDDTVLTTVRAISDLSELYSQYTEYRLEMLEERIRAHLKKIRRRGRRPFDTTGTKLFLTEQEQFLAGMNRQIVHNHLVTKGSVDNSHLHSTDLKDADRKKARKHLERQAS